MTNQTNPNPPDAGLLNGRKMPKRIWLLTYRHDGDVCWSEDPNPEDADEIESVEYVRVDNETKATRPDALIQQLQDLADFCEGEQRPHQKNVNRLCKAAIAALATRSDEALLREALQLARPYVDHAVQVTHRAMEKGAPGARIMFEDDCKVRDKIDAALNPPGAE